MLMPIVAHLPNAGEKRRSDRLEISCEAGIWQCTFDRTRSMYDQCHITIGRQPPASSAPREIALI